MEKFFETSGKKLGNIVGKGLDFLSAKKEKSPKSEPKVEALRPIVRSVLMKDEITEKDREVLRKKAVSVGLDSDEFDIQFDALLSSKQKAGKKSLFGKKISYEDYFDEDEEGGFEEDFEKIFFSNKERGMKEEDDDEDNLRLAMKVGSSLLGGL